MPIYEYECADCGHCFEMLHGINEKPALSCADCSSGNVRRIMSAGAFHFKGSGFYATDYKSKSNGSSGKKAESCSSGSEAVKCPAAKPET